MLIVELLYRLMTNMKSCPDYFKDIFSPLHTDLVITPLLQPSRCYQALLQLIAEEDIKLQMEFQKYASFKVSSKENKPRRLHI
jgi:hypothetical protein